MRPVLLSQTPHKFYSIARNNDGEKFVRYKCEGCGLEGKRYGLSEVIHIKDNAPSECNPDKEDPMPRKKKEEAPVVEQTQEQEPVQQSAFEGDRQSSRPSCAEEKHRRQPEDSEAEPDRHVDEVEENANSASQHDDKGEDSRRKGRTHHQATQAYRRAEAESQESVVQPWHLIFKNRLSIFKLREEKVVDQNFKARQLPIGHGNATSPSQTVGLFVLEKP